MDIKKGIKYVALGFLFILVNVNLNFNGTTVNISPNFLGWIFLFAAFDKLGKYGEGKTYLKWFALLMVAFTAVLWVLNLIRYQVDLTVANVIVGVCQCMYNYILFGMLEEIARDYGSERKDKIHNLKILNLACYIALTVSAAVAYNSLNKSTALLFFAVGLAALVVAIVTLVTLFKFSNELHDRDDIL